MCGQVIRGPGLKSAQADISDGGTEGADTPRRALCAARPGRARELIKLVADSQTGQCQDLTAYYYKSTNYYIFRHTIVTCQLWFGCDCPF